MSADTIATLSGSERMARLEGAFDGLRDAVNRSIAG